MNRCKVLKYKSTTGQRNWKMKKEVYPHDLICKLFRDAGERSAPKEIFLYL